MLIVCCGPRRGHVQVLGAIGCQSLQPVSNYVWLHPTGAHDHRIDAALDNYSRWSEPATGLLARVLARRSTTAPPYPLLQDFRCELLVGQHVDTARVIEQLDVSLVQGELHTEYRDELLFYRKTAPRREEYTCLFDLLTHAARVSVWGADEEPPIPPPLTGLPIYELNGAQVILEADMPQHARRHFFLRHQGGPVPARDAFYAHSWLAFIGA